MKAISGVESIRHQTHNTNVANMLLCVWFVVHKSHYSPSDSLTLTHHVPNSPDLSLQSSYTSHRHHKALVAAERRTKSYRISSSFMKSGSMFCVCDSIGHKSRQSSRDSLHSRSSRSNSPHLSRKSSYASRHKGSRSTERRHRPKGAGAGGGHTRLTAHAQRRHRHTRATQHAAGRHTLTPARAHYITPRSLKRQSLYKRGILPMGPNQHEQSTQSLVTSRTGTLRPQDLAREGSTASLYSANTTPEQGESIGSLDGGYGLTARNAPYAARERVLETGSLKHTPRRTSVIQAPERRLSQTAHGHAIGKSRNKRRTHARKAKGLAAPFGSSHK